MSDSFLHCNLIRSVTSEIRNLNRSNLRESCCSSCFVCSFIVWVGNPTCCLESPGYLVQDLTDVCV